MRKTRAADRWRAVWIAAVAVVAVVPRLAAGDIPLRQVPFGDWVLVSGEGLCQLRHTRISTRSGAVLLEMLLVPTDGSVGGALVGLRVPLGVSLADGIAWRHPSTPDVAVALAWQHCDAELCLAAGAISETELARLKRGRSIEVGFRPLPTADPIRLPVSLRGVTAGWRAVGDCMAGSGG